ncbi:MAG: hypothetical protein ABJF79_13100 [Paracoccaceae bacterium]
MTNTSAKIGCSDICSPKGTVDQTCSCSKTTSLGKAKAAKYGGGFIALCALCCAVPPAFIALGLMSVTTGAYFSAGSTVALVALGILGFSYLLMQYVKRKR